jgi:hypothetical protein
MVTGPAKSYLWILCRDKSLDKKNFAPWSPKLDIGALKQEI